MDMLTELTQVAEIYRYAMSAGDAPTVAVAQQGGYSKATAGRRITAAREADLLDVEPLRGLPPRRLHAVANAIGVSPQDLYDAVKTHAQGRLTVT